MEQFFRAIGVVLLAVTLILTLRADGKAMGQLLSLAVCCMVLGLGASFLSPIIDFVQTLSSVGDLDQQLVTTLLKVVGISATAEISTLLCDDSGNSALGKVIQLLATAVMLYLSLPMLTALLQLIEGVLKSL